MNGRGETTRKIGFKNAFTLVEMLVVLIVMGILLMFTIGLSGGQIQKIESKTIKESILSERQSRYSRNLGSSSYAGIMYKYMDIKIESGTNQISFMYEPRKEGTDGIQNIFSNKFVINAIITNTDDTNLGMLSDVIIRYSPYQIACQRGEINNGELNTSGMKDKLGIIAQINDSEYYCFEIREKNCRLVETIESDCTNWKNYIGLDS